LRHVDPDIDCYIAVADAAMYDEPETFGRAIAEITRETIGEAE
jgi:hypothetical protein